ncbi:hypothetical protein EVAR_58169_1 [Eumeta japonica]|uniref:Uncharacterized protein n=1 Tax=Eumeta variegata TaxID=151549 RepID=A0A4C1X0X2_EUMVA|nr:hypothetical protein EVAR_58169_1 [Eumeta japonica]
MSVTCGATRRTQPRTKDIGKNETDAGPVPLPLTRRIPLPSRAIIPVSWSCGGRLTFMRHLPEGLGGGGGLGARRDQPADERGRVRRRPAAPARPVRPVQRHAAALAPSGAPAALAPAAPRSRAASYTHLRTCAYM